MAAVTENAFLNENPLEKGESALEKLFRGPRMTKEFIRKHCKEHKLYQTPYLNDVLYLHYKGFSRIENLEEYTGLRCLWLENNGINKISGLDNQTDLRSLFLHYNLIRKIENLENCPSLNSINLSHNQVKKIENLENNTKLQTLNLGNNYIETIQELEHLELLQEVTVLDLSNNHIEDPLIVEIFGRMANLRVLCLSGNPVVRKIPAYRKTLILACLELRYLDDRPVFPRDRACAEAWKRGGIAEEIAERQRWIDRENQRIMDSVDALIRMRDERRAQRVLQQEDSGMGASVHDLESERASISENQPFEADNMADDTSNEGDEIAYDYAKACEELDEEIRKSKEEEEFMDDRQTEEDTLEYRENIFDFEPKTKQDGEMLENDEDSSPDLTAHSESLSFESVDECEKNTEENRVIDDLHTIDSINTSVPILEDRIEEVFKTKQDGEMLEKDEVSSPDLTAHSESLSVESVDEYEKNTEANRVIDDLHTIDSTNTSVPILEGGVEEVFEAKQDGEMVENDEDSSPDLTAHSEFLSFESVDESQLVDHNSIETNELDIIEINDTDKYGINTSGTILEYSTENEILNDTPKPCALTLPISELRYGEECVDTTNETTFVEKIETCSKTNNNLELIRCNTEDKTTESTMFVQEEVTRNDNHDCISEETIPLLSKVSLTEKDSGISVSPEPFYKGVSIGLQTESEPNSSFQETFNELTNITQLKNGDLLSSDSESDSDDTERSFYEALDVDPNTVPINESDSVQEIFTRKPEPRTIMIGEDKCDINDIRELLTWEFNTRLNNTVVPLPYQKPRSVDDFKDDECHSYIMMDAKENSTYNNYIKECDKKVERAEYKEPMVTNMLQITPPISVFGNNHEHDREQLAKLIERRKGTEEDSIENTLIMTNSISDVRMDMKQFSDDIKAFTEKYNKEYQDLMETFMYNYNKCSEIYGSSEQVESVPSTSINKPNRQLEDDGESDMDLLESQCEFEEETIAIKENMEYSEELRKLQPYAAMTNSADGRGEKVGDSTVTTCMHREIRECQKDESVCEDNDVEDDMDLLESQCKFEDVKFEEETIIEIKENMDYAEELRKLQPYASISKSADPLPDGQGENVGDSTVNTCVQREIRECKKEESVCEDLPIVKTAINCTLEMQLAKETM
ncbi:hypothetical protein RI129_012238 [Pyrocoelia pectoralis]|uniref:Dynein axonemal assembly factor 1 homolog n=1 Tax=Pyrocoelia pectoralis TaxID=417401 RepID=A0AAN7ZFR0_9COLE